MRIEEDVKLDFQDVLIKPKRSTLTSRKEVTLDRRYTFKHSGRDWAGVPIIAANMDHTGTVEMAQALNDKSLMVALHKFYDLRTISDSLPMLTTDHVFLSTGITDDDFKKLQYAFQDYRINHIPNICIDVANGYSEAFVDFVKKVRDLYPDKTIMAGNVVSGEMVEQLILNGADLVKVGIGPGSVCTTRKMTGVGFPQLSAIIECADAAHGIGGLICADGGCQVPGDVAKAFAAGADFVMLGGMFAGHDECSGDFISYQQNKEAGDEISREALSSWTDIYMKFYGMSSQEAQDKHGDGLKGYRASEGKCVEVPYKGPVAGTVQEILGGIRSTCTYVGARRLKDLSKCTTFIRVNRQLNNKFED